MNQTIGILKDYANAVTDFFGMSHIDIYKKEEEWKLARTISKVKLNTESGEELRKSLETIMNQMGSCKILIGTTIVGMPYHILCREGFVLCEADSFSTLLLDQVYEDYCLKEPEPKEEPKEVKMAPWAVDLEGNYYFDMIEVQKYHPEISSKKALLPFFSSELFQTLTIICNHVMPWLENYAMERNFQLKAKRNNGKYYVVISHNNCFKGEEMELS